MDDPIPAVCMICSCALKLDLTELCDYSATVIYFIPKSIVQYTAKRSQLLSDPFLFIPSHDDHFTI